MFNKLSKHFKDNGFKETYKRAIKRILNSLGISSSESYFLRLMFEKTHQSNGHLPKYKVELLDNNRLSKFNKVKYYDFLIAEELIKDQNSFIFIALDNEEIIGYVCCRKSKIHEIHDLGFWDLQDDEAWIGPTFVNKTYRNKSVHRLLLNNSIKNLHKIGVKKFYTAINVENEASIRSFTNTGFYVIGKLKMKRRLNKLLSLTAVEYNQEKIFKNKYKAVHMKK